MVSFAGYPHYTLIRDSILSWDQSGRSVTQEGFACLKRESAVNVFTGSAVGEITCSLSSPRIMCRPVSTQEKSNSLDIAPHCFPDCGCNNGWMFAGLENRRFSFFVFELPWFLEFEEDMHKYLYGRTFDVSVSTLIWALTLFPGIAGPTGTGKTVNVVQHLQTGVSDSFVPLCLAFSAQTSANQTQASLRSHMQKADIHAPEIEDF